MRHLTALVVAISMAATGCATYQGARQARNAGIVMGVVGVAALAVAGGIALSRQSEQNDPPCLNDGNGCAFSGADVGVFFLTLTGIGLIPYALAFGIVGSSGMEKHSPEAQRREQERAEQARIEREHVAREQREAAEQDRERERAARDKAYRRDQAFALLKNAVEASRADRCAAAIELETRIRELDANVHDAWFARDPNIRRCLAPTPPMPTPPTPTPTQ